MISRTSILLIAAIAFFGGVKVAETFLAVSPVLTKNPAADETKTCTSRSALMDPFAMNGVDMFQWNQRNQRKEQPPDLLSQLFAPFKPIAHVNRVKTELFTAFHDFQPQKWTLTSQKFMPVWISWLQPFTDAVKQKQTQKQGDTDVVTYELLAEQGNWQAYFDAPDTCSVYYFNARTGASQWEPPAGFPAPKLSISQLARTTARSHRMLASRGETDLKVLAAAAARGAQAGVSGLLAAKKGAKKPNDDDDEKPWWLKFFDNKGVRDENDKGPSWFSLFDKKEKDDRKGSWLFFSGDDTTKEQKKDTDVIDTPLPFFASMKEEVNEQPFTPWDLLFRAEEKKEKQQAATTSDPKHHYETEKGDFSTDESSHQPPTVQGGGFASWMEDLPLFLSGDTSSRTRILFSPKNIPIVGTLLGGFSLSEHAPAAQPAAATEPADERLRALEEKRYADSDARQANLRKNYQKVVSDRSPTISLTSMKKKKQKDWFKYLGD